MMDSAAHLPDETFIQLGGTEQIKPISTGLKTISPASLQGRAIPERQWVVPNWIPRHCTSSLYGDGGTGKSLLAMQLMTSITLGKEWIGLPTAELKTWGLFCEDNPDELHIRQNDINRSYGCDFSDLKGMRWLSGAGEDNILMGFDAKSGAPLVTNFYKQIEKDVLESGSQFVVIDTAADTFGGLENNRGHVRQFIGLLTGLAMKINGAVLFCAHPSAAGMANGRGDGGSTGWNNSVRSRMYFTTPKSDDPDAPQFATDDRILKRMKANYAPREEEIQLTWKEGAFSRPQQEGARGVVAQIDKASREKAAERTFLSGLDAAEAQGRALSWSKNAANFAPKIISKSPSSLGVSSTELNAAMERLFHRHLIRNVEYGRGKDSTKKIARVVPQNLENKECHGVQ